LGKVLNRSAAGEDFYLLLGDFLDDFYRSDTSSCQRMIETRPNENDVKEQQVYSAFAAATAHKLANDRKLSVPAWVSEKQFYLGKPFFGGNAKGNLRWWFLYNSPSEFKHRNLFVCENVLERV
jgi:hypothetical protein